MQTHLTLALRTEPPISDTLSNILSHPFLNSNQTDCSAEFCETNLNMVKSDKLTWELLIKLAKICHKLTLWMTKALILWKSESGFHVGLIRNFFCLFMNHNELHFQCVFTPDTDWQTIKSISTLWVRLTQNCFTNLVLSAQRLCYE